MNNQKDQVKSQITEASNILVTVSQNPSVDELTAALGLTLAIDKMRKHSSAIFSGQIPNFMKFLHPEKTFEDSTASFRDFIISLDKEKADKLRYKVEDNLVKIFITPYHTKLSPNDLMFDEGDLNVDLVIAIGVKRQEDLDQAIVGHGRILHSAAVATINLDQPSSLGTMHWSNIDASSYSEAIASLISEMDEKLLTKQISTALLTGIVIATEQFSNALTKPSTMTVASKLLSSGADQQLIVAEIRGQGNVAESAPNVVHDIPESINGINGVEQAVAGMIAPTSNVIPELEALPPAEPPVPIEDLESVKSSLDPYMPPPLPDFSTTLPASPPSPGAQPTTYSETPPAIFPETEVLPDADNKTTPPTPTVSGDIALSRPIPTPPVNKPNDPSQFIIPG